ncbi:hypothetical protein [Spirosoma sp.]|uniref:hypothetical protein n=1 Tax=Spirosoma sp. TaxID=1899569 RepID=UPI0026245439|nr:hypothetical protein [Spirosoma sp.]MCX6212785.1 hypothetical protein [Spirosoma sp.]
MLITVYYDHIALDVHAAIAKRLKLTPGQQVGTLNQAIDALSLSATHQALVEMASQRGLN